MFLHYRQSPPVEALNEPFPNSVMHGLEPSFLKEVLTVESPEAVDVPDKKFWRRQFGSQATKSQRDFDWFFGVILPVLCITFDPVVFRFWGEADRGLLAGTGILGEVKPFVYLLSFVSILAMIGWLLIRDQLQGLTGMLAGLFAVAGVLALVIGIALLPFSLVGLFVAIGVFGFTPLFTSIVFLRNSARAYRTAKEFLEPNLLQHVAILSAVFSAVIPYIFQIELRKILAFLDGTF